MRETSATDHRAKSDSDRVKPAGDDDWTRQQIAVPLWHVDLTRTQNDALPLRSSRPERWHLSAVMESEDVGFVQLSAAQVSLPAASVAHTSSPPTSAGTLARNRFSPYHVIGVSPPVHRTITDCQSCGEFGVRLS